MIILDKEAPNYVDSLDMTIKRRASNANQILTRDER